jgi:hypothetical protein
MKKKKVNLQFSRTREPGNSFDGPLHITVVKVDDFKDTYLDKLDPSVELELGDEFRKTSCIPNAGGTGVEFHEILSFDKRSQDAILKIRVLDQNTLADDLLGERAVDVNIQAPPAGEESERPLAFAMVKKGKTVGKVYLLFSRCTPKGAFSGPLFVTVTRIEGFGDTAGFMDKTDPLVVVEIGRQKQSTSCKVCVCVRARARVSE